METTETCSGCGQELLASLLPGVKKICPNFFTESDTFHDMIPEAMVKPLEISQPFEKTENVEMEDLGVGDVIEVWWSPGRDTILALEPYRGPLDCLAGAKVARMALLPSGSVTIEPGTRYSRIVKGGD